MMLTLNMKLVLNWLFNAFTILKESLFSKLQVYGRNAPRDRVNLAASAAANCACIIYHYRFSYRIFAGGGGGRV